ncbi:TonB-dependent siderophore receptor [Sesbania bispinosa]|nr:TonB-dependent siderophore receptor [Sesbania bispinosa]
MLPPTTRSGIPWRNTDDSNHSRLFRLHSARVRGLPQRDFEGTTCLDSNRSSTTLPRRDVDLPWHGSVEATKTHGLDLPRHDLNGDASCLWVSSFGSV